MATREKDNRKIHSGVSRWEPAGLKVYGPGQEDELEDVMAPGECANLLQLGAIEGDWKPEGQAPAVMPGSKAAKDAGIDQGKADAAAKRLDTEAGDKAKKRAEAEKKKAADAEKAEKEAAKGHEAPAKGHTPITQHR